MAQAVRRNGIGPASSLSVTTGLLTTTVSLALVTLINAGWWGTRPFPPWTDAVTAVVGAARRGGIRAGVFIAVGVDGATRVALGNGVGSPADVPIVGDPLGLSMTAGLIAEKRRSCC